MGLLEVARDAARELGPALGRDPLEGASSSRSWLKALPWKMPAFCNSPATRPAMLSSRPNTHSPRLKLKSVLDKAAT
ncbi:MAG: hypothetical protein C4332_12440 [Meiothermus sp.]